MSVFSFQTVREPATGLYKEKGSKFLSFLYPVRGEEEIKSILDQLRKEYFDARHHCFAWILDPEGSRFRAYDDGEPHHSAGDPILGQLRSRGLTNVLLVVVRYFGGTKLGVGGLVKAYKTAAADALDKATIVEEEVTSAFIVEYDYHATPDVMKLVSDFQLTITRQSFESACMVEVECPIRHEKEVVDRLSLLRTLGQVTDFRATERNTSASSE